MSLKQVSKSCAIVLGMMDVSLTDHQCHHQSSFAILHINRRTWFPNSRNPSVRRRHLRYRPADHPHVVVARYSEVSWSHARSDVSSTTSRDVRGRKQRNFVVPGDFSGRRSVNTNQRKLSSNYYLSHTFPLDGTITPHPARRSVAADAV